MTDLPIVVPDLHGRSDLLDVVLVAYPGRRLLFLGDYLDRGPDAPGVLARLMQQAVALCSGCPSVSTAPACLTLATSGPLIQGQRGGR